MKDDVYKNLLQEFEESLFTSPNTEKPSTPYGNATSFPKKEGVPSPDAQASLGDSSPFFLDLDFDILSRLTSHLFLEAPPIDNGKKSKKTAEQLAKERQKEHRQRVRTLFLKSGLKGWPQHHILEFILYFAIHRKDTKDLAIDLIDKFGSLKAVFDASPEELQEVPGIGPIAATLLKLIPALLSVYLEVSEADVLPVKSTQEASQLLQHMFLGATHESTVILCLDGNMQYLGARKVSEGSSLSTSFEVRRVSEEVLRLRGVYIYIAHNHVNAPATPSPQDWEATAYLTSALYHTGIYVKDHIIFGSSGDCVSMRESDPSNQKQISWADKQDRTL